MVFALRILMRSLILLTQLAPLPLPISQRLVLATLALRIILALLALLPLQHCAFFSQSTKRSLEMRTCTQNIYYPPGQAGSANSQQYGIR